MGTLPTGTVTFLFTDVEGSTRLLTALGDAYVGIHATHQRLIRAAIAAQGGIEVSTQGDSFFVVFDDAAAAVASAAVMQRALATERWPADGVVRVRMGLHTGQGILGGGDYIG